MALYERSTLENVALSILHWPISRLSEKQVYGFLSFELSKKHVSWNFETLTAQRLIAIAVCKILVVTGAALLR